jgi:hypothetical protein
MTYRRQTDHERDRMWKTWVLQNQSDFERLGLPLALYRNQGNWERFLMDGCFDHEPNEPHFDIGDLSPNQMAQLLTFLQRHYGENPPALVGFLRVRLNEPPSSK